MLTGHRRSNVVTLILGNTVYILKLELGNSQSITSAIGKHTKSCVGTRYMYMHAFLGNSMNRGADVHLLSSAGRERCSED